MLGADLLDSVLDPCLDTTGWAKCSFINTLPLVSSLDQSYRWEAEFWMASNPDWRPKMCYNVTHNMYYSRTYPREYEGAVGCRLSES